MFNVKFCSDFIAFADDDFRDHIDFSPYIGNELNNELKELLLPAEVNKVIDAVSDACALTPQKVEEATQAFLRGQGPELLNSSSPTTEPQSTQSSEPVKDSESTPSQDGTN